MEKIIIAGKEIGIGLSSFIIAEAGVNHNGDLALAKELVDAAKSAGVDAVKFQTFKSERIVTPEAKQAEYQAKNIGKAESQYEMLKRLELSYDNFRELKRYCDKSGIIFMSTPHSCEEDVDLVAELCPAIKIGSGDMTNLPILKYAAKKNLPLIIGTGMSTMEEVKEAVDAIMPLNNQLIMLHCTTNYPTPLNEVNLCSMTAMEKELGTQVGYSDHTEGIKVSLAARALGACVIEKHFTLDRRLPGPDHKASLEPAELNALVGGVRKIENEIAAGKPIEDIIRELEIAPAMGNGIKCPTSSEIETAKVARKSIVASCDIGSGTVISAQMLAIKRPGTGILPKYLENIVGKRTVAPIRQDELISWEKMEK